MKKLIASLMLLTYTASSVAVEKKEWNVIAKTDQTTWEYRSGSLLPKKDQTGEVFWTVQFRIYNNVPNPTIDFKRYAISLADCQKEEGVILLINTQNTTDGKVEFIFGGGTIASTIAEKICGAGNLYLKNLEKTDKDPPAITS